MFRTILKRQLATVCASTRARWRGRAIPLSPLLVRRDLTHSRARPGGVAASRFAVYAPHGEPHPLAIISQQTLLSIDRIGVNSPRCGSRSSASDGGHTRVPSERTEALFVSARRAPSTSAGATRPPPLLPAGADALPPSRARRRTRPEMSERKSTRVKTVAKALKRVDDDTRRQVRLPLLPPVDGPDAQLVPASPNASSHPTLPDRPVPRRWPRRDWTRSRTITRRRRVGVTTTASTRSKTARVRPRDTERPPRRIPR